MEAAAEARLQSELEPFEDAMRGSYEAGVQAPTLPGSRQRDPDMIAAAPFLKRTLTDLRGVWLLLRRGYTAQGAAVAASLWENSHATQCLAGSEENVQLLKGQADGDLPWGPQQMAQMIARKQSGANDPEYEKLWRERYSGYKWLCKIKHPTQPSAQYETGTTVTSANEYVVMAAPDVRAEDRVMKATIIAIAIRGAGQAVLAFADALDTDKSDPYYRDFDSRLTYAADRATAAFTRVTTGRPLPFDISASSLAKQWRKAQGGD